VDIDRARALLTEIEDRQNELTSLLTGNTALSRKPQKCSKCGQEGHNARQCTVSSELLQQ
jgi:hypothetical protein